MNWRKMKNGFYLLMLTISIMTISSCGNDDSSDPDPNPVPEEEIKPDPTVKLYAVDPDATEETKALFANLWLLGQTHVMFGHHDYPSYGVGWSGQKDRSDVKDITGDYPAVYGVDMNGIDNTKINFIKAAYRRGGVSMLVWHQDNPLTEGQGSYPVGTAWDNTKVVDQILIEGSAMNIKYKKRLDTVASWFNKMVDDNNKPIPVIFRPLHEHTQSWSWWGSSATTDKEFIAFWRFIIKYLRDEKNVHNVLYAISPQMDEDYGNGAKDRLLFRWPGDAYVDFIGIDCYNGLNRQAFIANLKALSDLGKEKKLPVGVTETGLENNHTKNYWTYNLLEPLKQTPVSMVVAWRNESTSHAYGPYPSDISAADFLVFYQDELTLFEKDLPKMYIMPEGIIVK